MTRLLKSCLRSIVLVAGLTACSALEDLYGPVDDEEGSDRNAGGGPPSVYQGSYEGEVRHLLNRVNGWRTSSNAQTDGGVPPNVSIGAACIRDTYVAAAVQYAWAAESYYRLRLAQAASMAEEVHNNLLYANSLCSSASGGGLNNCRTLSLWGCPPPNV